MFHAIRINNLITSTTDAKIGNYTTQTGLNIDVQQAYPNNKILFEHMLQNLNGIRYLK